MRVYIYMYVCNCWSETRGYGWGLESVGGGDAASLEIGREGDAVGGRCKASDDLADGFDGNGWRK